MESTGLAPHVTDTNPLDVSSQAPAVSIVVPCYNGGRFLDGLIASLARQTFRDFEVIIVDDGSTDQETIRKLDALAARVRVIRQDNRGPSAARNTGIRAACADILFMLDCDDIIEATFLAETVPALRTAPPDVAMVFTHLRLIGAETGLVSRYFNRFDLLFTNTLSSGLVVRKQCCEAVGGYDETMRDGYEDWDFSLRLATAGFNGIEIAKPLYVYHIGSEQTYPSRSSGVDKRRLYGKLWREIRTRHAASYRPLAMLRLWQATRDGRGRVTLWKGLAAYILALLLPDFLFNQLIARLHRRHRADSPGPAYSVPTAQPGLAP
jgi:glycosyltransferase involved in cell wall biosynthesis